MIRLIILGPGHKHADDTFGNRIPVLQGSWCVITQMLWVDQVLYMGFAVDLCHHVSSCFSFWGKDKPMRLSCSYNYFCSSPFSMPSLYVKLSVAIQAWVSIPEDMTQECLSQVSEGGGLGTNLIFNAIYQIKLRNLMKLYNAISWVKMITQGCCSDRLITQPTYFSSSTRHRLHPTARVQNVRMPQLLWVICVILTFFSSSINNLYTAVLFSAVFKG